jgi:hypothetical protein
VTELEGEPAVGGGRTPRTTEAANVGAGGDVSFSDVRGVVNVYQGVPVPAVPSAPGLNAAIIGTTLLSARGTYRLDTASLPHAYLGNIGPAELSVAERVRENLGLHVLAELASPADFPAAVASMIDVRGLSENDSGVTGVRSLPGYSDDDVVERYDELRGSWPTVRSRPDLLPPELVSFAEYVAFAEVILVEESPPRRTSPAGQAAAALAARIMTTGSGATLCSASFNGEHFVATVIVGSGATIVMASAGSAITLMSYWVGRKLRS